ncbi:MAG: hypothetical protein JWQ97_975 [Phenylobacterium sp.]|nr:hypothetical protein [Phenylobacterium sp.]
MPESPLTARLVRDGLAGCEPLPPVPATAMLAQIVAHLKVALTVALPSADEIVIGHVRTAHELAVLVLRQAQRNAR